MFKRRGSISSSKTTETTFSQHSKHPAMEPYIPAPPRPADELPSFMGKDGLITGIDCLNPHDQQKLFFVS
ncbi:hypothetical protein HDU76_011975, partial [Blyttiomyces sp. JEL0837]